MSLEDEVKKRFETAAREGIRPGVLYGPKWLQPHPSGLPDEFIFVGTPKIVKASGRDLDRVLMFLRNHLDLSGLGLDYSVDEKGYFHVRPGKGGTKPVAGKARSKPPRPAAAAGPKPKAKPRPKKPTGQ